jgi:hypothetical protein
MPAQEPTSYSTSTGLALAREDWLRKAIRLGIVFALNLALTVLAVWAGFKFLEGFWSWAGPWRQASLAVDFVARCSAVATGLLTVLAIRRQWLGLLVAIALSLLHAYAFVFANRWIDEFWSHNGDGYIYESLYVGLFALGAHPVMRILRLGYPAPIDLTHVSTRSAGRRFKLSDLLLATALTGGYLGTINLADLMVDLYDEPFTPHLGITLSVFFMASVISPVLWVLLRERTLTVHWLWIVLWCTFPIAGELVLNALVFRGSNPYYWVESRIAEIIACVSITLIDGLTLRAFGFRWNPLTPQAPVDRSVRPRK